MCVHAIFVLKCWYPLHDGANACIKLPFLHQEWILCTKCAHHRGGMHATHSHLKAASSASVYTCSEYVSMSERIRQLVFVLDRAGGNCLSSEGLHADAGTASLGSLWQKRRNRKAAHVVWTAAPKALAPSLHVSLTLRLFRNANVFVVLAFRKSPQRNPPTSTGNMNHSVSLHVDSALHTGSDAT
jgi:hypothetical protein